LDQGTRVVAGRTIFRKAVGLGARVVSSRISFRKRTGLDTPN